MPTTPERRPPEAFDPHNAMATFRAVTLAVLFSPRTFFAAMRPSGGLVNPGLYLVACVLVNTVIVGLINKDVRLMIQSLALGVTFPFITAGLMHLILTRLLGARGSYEAALRVNAYAAAVNLVSWIPLVGAFLELYRVYVITVGLGIVFQLPARKAFLAVALTIALLMLAALGIGQFGAQP
jgi:hypothetical protein